MEDKHLYDYLLNYMRNKKAKDNVSYKDTINEIESAVAHLKEVVDNVLEHTCCICGCDIEGFGNNPFPISDEGRCCDDCNNKVIMARLGMLSGENE